MVSAIIGAVVSAFASKGAEKLSDKVFASNGNQQKSQDSSLIGGLLANAKDSISEIC